MFKKGMREEASQAIARFFYNNVIPFNVAKSEKFIALLDLVSRHGLGFKPPSYHEIRVKYLKEEVQIHPLLYKNIGMNVKKRNVLL